MTVETASTASLKMSWAETSATNAKPNEGPLTSVCFTVFHAQKCSVSSASHPGEPSPTSGVYPDVISLVGDFQTSATCGIQSYFVPALL